MKIWIRRVPPANSAEGIDLSHYKFRVGHVYEVGPRVAELLIDGGYAERERRAELEREGQDRDRAADKSGYR